MYCINCLPKMSCVAQVGTESSCLSQIPNSQRTITNTRFRQTSPRYQTAVTKTPFTTKPPIFKICSSHYEQTEQNVTSRQMTDSGLLGLHYLVPSNSLGSLVVVPTGGAEGRSPGVVSSGDLYWSPIAIPETLS